MGEKGLIPSCILTAGGPALASCLPVSVSGPGFGLCARSYLCWWLCLCFPLLPSRGLCAFSLLLCSTMLLSFSLFCWHWVELCVFSLSFLTWGWILWVGLSGDWQSSTNYILVPVHFLSTPPLGPYFQWLTVCSWGLCQLVNCSLPMGMEAG